MMMKTVVVASLVSSTTALISNPRGVGSLATVRGATTLRSNANLFGGESKSPDNDSSASTGPNSKVWDGNKYLDKAARLRQEAAELEIALREEARAKGLPEEMVNKLVPKPQTVKAPVAANVAASTKEDQKEGSSSSTATALAEKRQQLATAELRAKLGYLNTGDAIRMTSELDRIKSKGIIHLWHSNEIGVKPNFMVNNAQFTSKTKIEPVKLKLDDVGFEYQRVLIAALFIGTTCGLASSQIGGQLGFLLGYASALFPILLVGLGSIAPTLIGEILNRFKYATNAEARDKFVHMNAGKFLVGYVLGLPVARFSAGGPSNQVEFFQLRPGSKSDIENKQMFAKNKFKQTDIARASAACVGGNVAECIVFGESSGANPVDIQLLFELMNTVEPALSPEAAQGHVRWSALKAYEILSAHKEEYKRLVDAFAQGLPLEDCIAIMEGK